MPADGETNSGKPSDKKGFDRIFLSYGRGDDEPFVRRLRDDLTKAGFDVWFDRVSMPSRSLTFHQEIRDAIAARERLILVVGPKAVTSDYVTQEWQFIDLIFRTLFLAFTRSHFAIRQYARRSNESPSGRVGRHGNAGRLRCLPSFPDK